MIYGSHPRPILLLFTPFPPMRSSPNCLPWRRKTSPNCLPPTESADTPCEAALTRLPLRPPPSARNPSFWLCLRALLAILLQGPGHCLCFTLSLPLPATTYGTSFSLTHNSLLSYSVPTRNKLPIDKIKSQFYRGSKAIPPFVIRYFGFADLRLYSGMNMTSKTVHLPKEFPIISE